MGEGFAPAEETEMKKTVEFTVSIQAPRSVVWETMLGVETYEAWTAPFCEGTYYTGSWEQGSEIRFLAPNGDGMVGQIAENRPHEFVSVRHLGEIKSGVVDTDSEAVRAWAPAYENFAFRDTGEGTEVTVTVDTLASFEPYMKKTYPKALALLKEICEKS